MAVNSVVKINRMKVNQLSKAAITALEKTAEALHTEIVQAQVVPRDTGNLQNESMFVDFSKSGRGLVSIVHSTPYSRRLYYHPEYNFDKGENPNAKGKWFEDWEQGGKHQNFAKKEFEKVFKQESGV